MAIRWTPDLAVGIDEIDRQHQQLFQTCDDLLEAMRQGKGRSEVGAVLGFLERYVIEHFATEERAMLAADYPRFRDHKAEHEAFAEQFAALVQRHSTEGATAATVIQVNNHICDWLRSHIARTDRLLAGFLTARR